MTIFNNAGCVDHIWYYDNNDTTNPNWRLHIADGNTYNYCGETLDSLKKGQGFWVKASGNCTIEIDEPSCNPLGMPIPPNPDSCDINGTNPDNNQTTPGVSTGLPANTTVISSTLGDRTNANISYIIVDSKETFKDNYTLPNTYNHGYFKTDATYCEIQIDESFKLWTAVSNQYPDNYKGRLKITNIVTKVETITPLYPDIREIGKYYLMTNTLPAGTYKFEKLGTTLSLDDMRMDGGWFFEAIR